jgi:hypothetical protein
MKTQQDGGTADRGVGVRGRTDQKTPGGRRLLLLAGDGHPAGRRAPGTHAPPPPPPVPFAPQPEPAGPDVHGV